MMSSPVQKEIVTLEISETFISSKETHDHPPHDFFEETPEEFAARVLAVLEKYKEPEPEDAQYQADRLIKKEKPSAAFVDTSHKSGQAAEEAAGGNAEIMEAMSGGKTSTETEMVDKRSLAYRKPYSLWNTAIFFPDKHPELPNSATNRMLFYFQEAKMSIQICCFLASFRQFERIIIEKQKQGLCIQVITDHDTMEAHNNFSCHSFERTGIPVWTRNTGCLMHNKFVIIDDEAVLTGSLNYTKTAFSVNFENVLVTTDERVVDAYRKRYAHLLYEIERAHKAEMEAIDNDVPATRHSRLLQLRML